MHFDYLVKLKKEESIDIENIGNCAIEVWNNLGFEWLLIIKTNEGLTEVVEYGPLLPDIKYPPANVSYTYSRFDFSESKISKRIDKFLNDGYRNITQAFEISRDEAASRMRNLVEFLYDCE